MIKKILALVNKIPQKERKKLDGLTFVVEKDMFQIANGGQFIVGRYFRDNSIVFYEPLIKTDKDLKRVLVHEICHHFGMNEKQVENYLKKK